jgi:hypothetical protein
MVQGKPCIKGRTLKRKKTEIQLSLKGATSLFCVKWFIANPAAKGEPYT